MHRQMEGDAEDKMPPFMKRGKGRGKKRGGKRGRRKHGRY